MTPRKVASVAVDTLLLIWTCVLGAPLVLLSAVLSEQQPNDVTRLMRRERRK